MRRRGDEVPLPGGVDHVHQPPQGARVGRDARIHLARARGRHDQGRVTDVTGGIGANGERQPRGTRRRLAKSVRERRCDHAHARAGLRERERPPCTDAPPADDERGDRRAVDHHRVRAHRNWAPPGPATRNATYSTSTATNARLDTHAARRACQPPSKRPNASADAASHAPVPQTICGTSSARYATEYAAASTTPSVRPSQPPTAAMWFTRSSVSSGGKKRKIAPKRRDLSSRRSMRYMVPAAAAVANAAMPTKLS